MVSNAFTSANTSVLINNKFLSGIQDVIVEDKILPDGRAGYTTITLKRYVIDNDDIVNDMRTATFSFKLTHNATNAGYMSIIANVDGFTMRLNRADDGKDVLMEQIIVIKAPFLRFVVDTRSDVMKITEKDDFDNLIKMLADKRKVNNKVVLPATVNTSPALANSAKPTKKRKAK